MVKIFKITKIKQIKALIPFFVMLTIISLLYYYLEIFSENSINKRMFIALMSIPILPVIYIHSLYFYENKNSILTINYDLSILNYNSQKDDISVPFSEILTIILVLSQRFDSDAGGFGWPFDEYHYIEIHTSKDKIIITSLMVENLKEIIGTLNSKIEKKITLLPVF